MDAWSALWFWPVLPDDDVAPPTVEEWIATLEQILGRSLGVVKHKNAKKNPGEDQLVMGTAASWYELDTIEVMFSAGGAANPETLVDNTPWLRRATTIADEQRFFHWELDFVVAFDRGGFDLQVRNPPWVRPRSDVDALLAEGNPWFQLAVKPTQAAIREKREETLALPGLQDLVIDGTSEVSATAAFVGSPTIYPHLAGLQPDLYRCFMEQTWRHSNDSGITSLVHPESHFVDEKAQTLRGATYRRLRRHWQFINELRLYEEIHHLVDYGVHVYGSEEEPSFLQASSLYHPDTVQRSLDHNGDGVEPGLKDDHGKWDLRPHQNRIIKVDREVLSAWHALLESDDVPVEKTRMVYTVNRAAGDVLEKIAQAPRVAELKPRFSSGWHEKNDRTKGYFDVEWGVAKDWDDAILQGPHLHVATPFFKSPNSTMRNNLDWSDIDLHALEPDALPVTSYKPAGDRDVYDANYTHWDIDGESVPARNYYRIAWRNMAVNNNERTLISAIAPSGITHIHGVTRLAASSNALTVGIGAVMSSIVADYTIRTAPKGTISGITVSRLAAKRQFLPSQVLLRYLRLNTLTDIFADLWRDVWEELAPDDSAEPHPFTLDAWTGGIDYSGRPALGDVGPEWTPDTPLRRETDRRQADRKSVV